MEVVPLSPRRHDICKTFLHNLKSFEITDTLPCYMESPVTLQFYISITDTDYVFGNFKKVLEFTYLVCLVVYLEN